MTAQEIKQLDDAHIVQLALKDVEYFPHLMDRYESKILAYIMRISYFSQAEAEDILQEVFIKAWKNLKGFDQDMKFSSWIYRIAHNETISQFRKFKARGGDKTMTIDVQVFDLVSEELDLHEQFDAEIKAKIIKQIVDNLADDYRDVLVLKFLEDKSYEEISDIMQKPSGTIATLINRAKKQFKTAYLKQQKISS